MIFLQNNCCFLDLTARFAFTYFRRKMYQGLEKWSNWPNWSPVANRRDLQIHPCASFLPSFKPFRETIQRSRLEERMFAEERNHIFRGAFQRSVFFQRSVLEERFFLEERLHLFFQRSDFWSRSLNNFLEELPKMNEISIPVTPQDVFFFGQAIHL